MTTEQLHDLGQRILRMTTVDGVRVNVSHSVQSITRLSTDRVLSSDNGESVRVYVDVSAGGPPGFNLWTNQLDDRVLLEGVRQCEALIRSGPAYPPDTEMKDQPLYQDTPVPVRLWYDATFQAMTTLRDTTIPEIFSTVRGAQLHAAGFIGIMARAEAFVLKKDGVIFSHDETDSEVNVVARSKDGKSTGWGGQASRDWSAMRVTDLTQRAIDVAKRGMNPVALEPGRRTAIFTPAAIAQMVRYLTEQWDAGSTDNGDTALSEFHGARNKLGKRIMDPRLDMSSDPADPSGGYRPYVTWPGVATPAMRWVEGGVLKNLAYAVNYAMDRGKQYASQPYSLRLSGGQTSVEEMITQCEEGILVNRVADVDLLDKKTCLLTGVTNGGCFLIKDGKITKPVKNFRFVESPFFFLNKIESLGVPERASFGYTPKASREPEWDFDIKGSSWPRPPVIVPPMMVRDFNFSALVDAV
jgi:hypothetical protein